VNIPDGLTLVMTANSRYGAPGDVKTISHSVALELLRRGLAKRLTTETVVPSIVPISSAPTNGISRPTLAVTAICPTFNRRKYLPTAIACFLSQTYTNSELLIVDDSRESVEDLVPKHPRIRYMRLDLLTVPKNTLIENVDGQQGVATINGCSGVRMMIGAKRNVCCENARGEIIVHWDDDDWQAPGRIEDQVTALEKSGKSLLFYYNILYWDDATQRAARCFSQKSFSAPHGATFCYRKSFWEKTRFLVQGGGEDTEMFKATRLQNQYLIEDAKQFMVVRAHKHVDSNDCGNVSNTAASFGNYSIPLVNREEIPPAFFEPLLEIVPTALLGPTEDAVIGVVKSYDWPTLRPYAVSLARTGFAGAKILFVQGISQEARAGLTQLGFTLIDYAPLPSAQYFDFGRHRFKPVIDFLRQCPNRFRNIVWCDVRDLVFQSDPSAWLSRNAGTRYIVAASECYKVKDETVCNDGWAKHTAPADYTWLREEDVLCSGTFAGDAVSMLGVFSRIYEMTLSNRDPLAADQGMFQYIVRTSPYKEILHVPRMREGFCSTFWPQRVVSQTDTDSAPLYSEADGVVYAPETNVPFAIVHQYDRLAKWVDIMRRKYA